MGTKVKGLIRGIKKQIFDEEKEQEITIGAPTDVKHVAHIGCDGPAAESPSWMKGFDASQSGPSDKTRDTTPEVNRVSEDSSNRKARKDDSRHRNSRSVETSKDLPLLPRATKNRHHSMDNTMATETLSKETSTSSKSRQQRTHRRGSRRAKDENAGDDDAKSDIPKRSSRRSRKSKEESSGEGSTRSSTKSIGDESELGSEFGSDV